jgi:transposase
MGRTGNDDLKHAFDPRPLPVDFPAWDRVYAFFRRWRRQGLIEEFHDRLRGRVREAEGRLEEPTAGIIDSQSVRAASSVPAATRGYDGGKLHSVEECKSIHTERAYTMATGDTEAVERLLRQQLAHTPST